MMISKLQFADLLNDQIKRTIKSKAAWRVGATKQLEAHHHGDGRPLKLHVQVCARTATLVVVSGQLL